MVLWRGKRKKSLEEDRMKQKKDKFASINKTKNTGRIVVVTLAVLAICVTGVMCARKLMMDEKYISLEIQQECRTEEIFNG